MFTFGIARISSPPSPIPLIRATWSSSFGRQKQLVVRIDEENDQKTYNYYDFSINNPNIQGLILGKKRAKTFGQGLPPP